MLGLIALADETDSTAAPALAELVRSGVTPTILSGDGARTVEALARARGVRVAMAGDGVNNAPALAAADLSLAMGAGGDIAGQTSDVILMRRDLTLAPWFLGQCRRTRRMIRQNLFWALSYNLAMALSSVPVVANSLR